MSERGSVHEWMEKLYKRHGHLTPEIVKEAARPKDSPAHDYVFGVPPDQAAEAYYLSRAHDLIRRVRVRVVAKQDEPPRVVRVYHAVPGEERPYVYYDRATLKRDPDKAAAARTEAVRRLNQAHDALEDLDVALESAAESVRTQAAIGLVRQARNMVSAAADD